MLPGGFVTENAFKNVFSRFSKIPCLILEKEITDEQYTQLENIIKEFINHSSHYSYAILSLILADTHFSIINENKFFCFQFVAKVLNDINIQTSKSPEHMHPLEFTKINNITVLFERNLKDFCKKRI